jgi:hypothetical protein
VASSFIAQYLGFFWNIADWPVSLTEVKWVRFKQRVVLRLILSANIFGTSMEMCGDGGGSKRRQRWKYTEMENACKYYDISTMICHRHPIHA